MLRRKLRFADIGGPHGTSITALAAARSAAA
jgi:hypothetical protein